ncbi:MAG: hypothetical protein ACRDUA_23120, partial [Micromonosporaceae bacterium]
MVRPPATGHRQQLAPGYEYCASVRGRYWTSVYTLWTTERCTARPVDDRWLTAVTTGWTRASWSAFYLGTATHTSGYGASLTRPVQGKRFHLIATKCPTCGT